MVYTINMRKEFNARLISERGLTDYRLVHFGPCERMHLMSLPCGALRVESQRHAEALSARYWLERRQPMPVLIRIRGFSAMGNPCYDVNYANPNNPNDMALLDRYIKENEVYALCD